MNIEFSGLSTDEVAAIRQCQTDAYGLSLERQKSPGAGTPCRRCLMDTPAGADFLILAHRPFQTLNPYAETGPIFLCADDCQAAILGPTTPHILQSEQYIVRSYGENERIQYGTGKVVKTSQIPDYARELLGQTNVAFVDIRSAANNCFQCRVSRAS